MPNYYYIANDAEKVGVCDEDYDLLIGPDGFQCVLTEPEDRSWSRDGSAVVAELNKLQAIINGLREAKS